MRFLSLFSGIEAASVAWNPLGWKAAAVAEIEPFPCAVLAHHYPDVPNFGDVTKFKEWPDLGTIDVVCGGSPCQSFSVAGLRKGLADPRGNLSLTFLAVVDKYRPRYVVWENVPGVLSSNGGRDFASFLGGLGQLGYGWCYRVLDAQYARVDGFPYAVPQRRRRVVVVGYLGDWRRAAAVLSEPESVLGDTPPSRKAGQGTATDVATSLVSIGRGIERTGDTRGQDPVIALHVDQAARCVTAGYAQRLDWETENFVAHVGPTLRAGGNQTGGDRPYGTDVDTCDSLIAFGIKEHAQDAAYGVTLTLRAMPHDKSKPNGGGMLAVAIQAGATRENPSSGPDGVGVQEGIAYTVEARAEVQAVSYALRPDAGRTGEAKTPSLDAQGVPRLRDAGFNVCEEYSPTLDATAAPTVARAWAVRRLTPTECERLQGFPDNYTAITYRGKPAADGPRYKALGNSWAVNVFRWVGRRIEMVEEIAKELAA